MGVETVLEGSVRLAGTACGHRASPSRWTAITSVGALDREMEAVRHPDEIAATIVAPLELHMVGEAALPRIGAPRRPQPTALPPGRLLVEQTHQSASRRASLFERAIARDPSYALAHAGFPTPTRPRLLRLPATKVAFARAKEAAERALALDDGLAEAHTSVGLVRYWFEWEWEEAERELRRSLELDPRNQATCIFLGQLLAALGRRDEATAMARRGVDLDPLSPVFNGVASTVFYHALRHAEALELARTSLELDPDNLAGNFAAMLANSALGRHEEAVAAGERSVAVSARSPITVGELGYVYGAAGRQEQALALLDELEAASAREYVWPSPSPSSTPARQAGERAQRLCAPTDRTSPALLPRRPARLDLCASPTAVAAGCAIGPTSGQAERRIRKNRRFAPHPAAPRRG